MLGNQVFWHHVFDSQCQQLAWAIRVRDGFEVIPHEDVSGILTYILDVV